MSGFHQVLLAASGGYIFNYTISANTNNFNLKATAIAYGWDQVTPLKANVSVSPGVVVGTASVGSYAFDTGVTFPTGTELSLSIGAGAYIVGAGGGAGKGSSMAWDFTGPTDGLNGGPAFLAQYPVSITNNGTIGGGGGGGGGGSTDPSVNGGQGGGGGGGGAGHIAGLGNVGGIVGGGAARAGAGADGTTAYGGGGAGATSTGATSGGNGGDLGANGVTATASGAYPGGNGGVAGAAVAGNGYITWVATGTRLGAIA